ncbi:MAG1210 family protein [Pseudoduganella sp. R-43]|uniref:MAG1210 family protein n=1 Tax=unclassified Pseudoduganella TaxID=2637179 RepID=UPI003CF2E217
MIDDVHEPLEQYSSQFKTAHVQNTSDFFEDLVRRSGVDENANIKTVQELRKLETQAAGTGSSNRWWRILRGITIAAMLLAALYVFANYQWPWLLVPAVLFALAIYKLNRIINDSDAQLNHLREACDEKRALAWGQMAPLNRLFDWDIVAKLVQKTVPRIAFDSYFSNGRMEELRNSFRWSGNLGDDQSIVFSHSGVLNGNPFILARTLSHWMGSKTYHGSLHITWTEQHRNSEGKWETRTHHDTLHASIERPLPEYAYRTFIVYGNEAAPDLVFSRSPSELSKLDDGLFDKWRKNRAIKKLEAKSRDVNDGSAFTVMANREFDALFGATDRNHEVQFRLLFTPLAQQEMLKLLKDSQIGYGDTFAFDKAHMINVLESGHMQQTDISGAPEKFHAYELAQARRFFNGYHNDFFKSFYFGIAPLLAIPLYQQHRSHADIYKDTYSQKPCFWEHEAIANYHGETTFNHPDCVSRSILKTSTQEESDGSQKVHVTASGFGSVERIHYVSVHGGDGRSHQVPVHWDEYFEVQNSATMLVKEVAPPSDAPGEAAKDAHGIDLPPAFSQRGIDAGKTVLRRSIVSAVLSD